MTVTFPPGIESAGTGSVFLAPVVADPNSPKLAEFTGSTAVNLSCQIYGFETTSEQGKVESKRYCLAEAIESFGKLKNGIADIEVVYDPQNPDSVTYAGYKALKTPGLRWALFDRRGLPSRDPLAVGHVGDLFEAVEFGTPRRAPITNTEGEEHRTIFSVAVKGQLFRDVKIVA